ncbi:hypothetical protein ACIBAC_42435 [Streptomyces sp. NPDC051362]|uniref:hypothetical protein n=1 Tax=Streptomyces sp. NPDC051362 TaxID=3365651 RepID=UPI0037AB15D6
MGFSGHLVFARSKRPLLEAPLFGSTNPGMRNELQEWQPRPGGWQTLQLEQGIWEDEDLSTLVEWTGAPACVADVSDSSLALVTGLATNGRRWQAWLNLNNAAALLVEEPEDVDDVSLWMDTPEFDEAIGHNGQNSTRRCQATPKALSFGLPQLVSRPRDNSRGSRNCCEHRRRSWRSCSTRCWTDWVSLKLPTPHRSHKKRRQAGWVSASARPRSPVAGPAAHQRETAPALCRGCRGISGCQSI